METVSKVKTTIIGKAWVNQGVPTIMSQHFTLPADMNFSKNESYIIGGLTMRTDRSLNASAVDGVEEPVSLKAGEKLFFYTNQKRTPADPDFSVSVMLPEDVSNVVINNNIKGRDAWRAENPVVTV